TVNGSGVNLASVVALSPANGTAVSALTNPDGTYTIGGVPPGQYLIYAQPLPPPASGEADPDNIFPPQDSKKNAFQANTGFITQFYSGAGGGTRDWTQAQPINVNAGAPTGGISFNMQPRNGSGIPYALTYGYQGHLELASPPLPGGAPSDVVF